MADTEPELKPCGTAAAFTRHRRHGETPCDACREARRIYGTARKRAKGSRPRQRPACGTDGGYQRHRRDRETPCERCIQAHRDYQNTNNRRRAARAALLDCPACTCTCPALDTWSCTCAAEAAGACPCGPDCWFCHMSFDEYVVQLAARSTLGLTPYAANNHTNQD
jgi:hypothetical protein